MNKSLMFDKSRGKIFLGEKVELGETLVKLMNPVDMTKEVIGAMTEMLSHYKENGKNLEVTYDDCKKIIKIKKEIRK